MPEDAAQPSIHSPGQTSQSNQGSLADRAEVVRLFWEALELDPGERVVRFRDGFLPLQLIFRATVEYEAGRTLRRVERFLLRAVLELGRVEVGELSRATGIPQGPLVMFLEKLSRARVLFPQESGGYGVDRSKALEVTGKDELSVCATKNVSVLILPRTGDVLVLDSERFQELSRFFDRVRPVCGAPSGSLSGKDVLEVLNTAMREGRFAGLPERSLRFVGLGPREKDQFPEICPAYLLSGELRIEGVGRIFLDAQLGGWAEKGYEDGGGNEVYGLDLSGAAGLVSILSVLTELPIPSGLLSEHLAAATATITRVGRGRVEITTDIKLARALTQGMLLSQPVGLVARWETEELPVEVEYWARFRPASPGDLDSFALDDLLSQFLAGSLSARDVRERVSEVFGQSETDQGALPLDVAVNRLWELCHYVRAYELREKDVFCYD